MNEANESVIRNKPDKKVVIVGDVGIGKSCLIKRYIEQVFIETNLTVGTSFFIKQWNGKNIALWDTAGQEQFDGLRGFYCRGAHAMILCYNVCDRNSFTSLKTKHSKSLDQVSDNGMIVFVGTKCDMINHTCDNGVVFKRAVSVDEVMELYLELKNQFNPLGHPLGTIPIFETSAKTGKNVDGVFEYIFQTLVPSLCTDKPMEDSSSGMVHLLERSLSTEANQKCC